MSLVKRTVTITAVYESGTVDLTKDTLATLSTPGVLTEFVVGDEEALGSGKRGRRKSVDTSSKPQKEQKKAA